MLTPEGKLESARCRCGRGWCRASLRRAERGRAGGARVIAAVRPATAHDEAARAASEASARRPRSEPPPSNLAKGSGGRGFRLSTPLIPTPCPGRGSMLCPLVSALASALDHSAALEPKSRCKLRPHTQHGGNYFPSMKTKAYRKGGRYFSLNRAINASFPNEQELTLPMPISARRTNIATERMTAQMLDCEPFMMRILFDQFRRSCSDGSDADASRYAEAQQGLPTQYSRNALFVDSGANEGSWSLIAAAYGCEAIAIEPQPACTKQLVQDALHNGLDSRVHIYNRLLAPSAIALNVTADGCIGNRQFVDSSNAESTRSRSKKVPTHSKHVQSVRLDALPELSSGQARPIIWHIDVEGAEIGVLRSASRLFAEERIASVMVEVQTLLWARYGVSIDEGLRTAREIFHGWHCTVACSGAAFYWDTTDLGKCNYTVRAVPMHGETEAPGYGDPMDVFCTAPSAGVTSTEDVQPPQVSPPAGVQLQRHRASAQEPHAPGGTASFADSPRQMQRQITTTRQPLSAMHDLS